jgi:hypothetical protein
LVRHRRVARNEAASERINQHFDHFVTAGLAEHVNIGICAHNRYRLPIPVRVKTTSVGRYSASYHDRPCPDWDLPQLIEGVDRRRDVPQRTKIARSLLLHAADICITTLAGTVWVRETSATCLINADMQFSLSVSQGSARREAKSHAVKL